MNQSASDPMDITESPDEVKTKLGNSLKTQLEILRLVNESLRTNLISRDNKINLLLKENEFLKEEIRLLKNNLGKFNNSLFHILHSTGIEETLIEELKRATGQYPDENAFSLIEGINPDALEDSKPASTKTEKASIKTQTASMQTEKASMQTPEALPQTQTALLKTEITFGKTETALLQTDEALLQTNKAPMKTQKAPGQTEKALLKTENASMQTQNALRHAVSPLSEMKAELSLSEEAQLDEENFQMILEAVLRKGVKHKTYIENGIPKTQGDKHEVHTAELIEKSIHSFYKIPGFPQHKNNLIAFRMIFSLKHEFLNRFPVITTYITLASILLYFYSKQKVTPSLLLKDLGYSRATLYKASKLFKEKQWLESYGLKDSDAFYLSEKGRQFVQSVIAGV